MKKALYYVAVSLLVIFLTSCGNTNSSTKNLSQSRTQSEKFAKEKTTSASKKITTKSSSLSAQTSSSEIAQSSSNQQVTQQNSQTTTAPSASEPTTLTDFVNKYGMSPVAYKIEHDRMSEEEAYRSTSDSMKTSGEIQYQYSQYGIR